jgi:cell division protein FtsB
VVESAGIDRVARAELGVIRDGLIFFGYSGSEA